MDYITILIERSEPVLNITVPSVPPCPGCGNTWQPATPGHRSHVLITTHLDPISAAVVPFDK
jgi:hypothetical protein